MYSFYVSVSTNISFFWMIYKVFNFLQFTSHKNALYGAQEMGWCGRSNKFV